MTACLLNWNPKLWPWHELDEDRQAISQDGAAMRVWSVISYRQVKKGDQAFLMRVEKEPRGIVASGTIRTMPQRLPDPDRNKKEGWLVEVDLEVLLNPEKEAILPLQALIDHVDADYRWTPLASGYPIRGDTLEGSTQCGSGSSWEMTLAVSWPLRGPGFPRDGYCNGSISSGSEIRGSSGKKGKLF